MPASNHWLGKKFAAPIAKPFAPFFVAGAVILYGVNAAQNAMMESPEFKFDARNPEVRYGRRSANTAEGAH